MYVDNEIFEKWMAKLDGGIGEAIKYLKSLVNTSEVFDKDEKLSDNTDLCFMLHVSKRTLQRYRREGKLPYILLGQKIYYKTSDVREFVERTGDYWDKKAMDNVPVQRMNSRSIHLPVPYFSPPQLFFFPNVPM